MYDVFTNFSNIVMRICLLKFFFLSRARRRKTVALREKEIHTIFVLQKGVRSSVIRTTYTIHTYSLCFRMHQTWFCAFFLSTHQMANTKESGGGSPHFVTQLTPLFSRTSLQTLVLILKLNNKCLFMQKKNNFGMCLIMIVESNFSDK